MKSKGKRGGARVITYLKTEYKTVYLLSIFDKGEKDTISDNEIREIIEGEIIETDLPIFDNRLIAE